MTRPRDALFHANNSTRSVGARIRRWIVGTDACRTQKWQRSEIELKGDDVHRMHPAGTLVDSDPDGAQDAIRDHVQRGDRVDLELLIADDGNEPKAWYCRLPRSR